MPDLTRRDFLKETMFAGMIGTTAALTHENRVRAAEQPRHAPPARAAAPNILLIQCDQLRYDCLGHTGHPLVRTPHLDRLAAEGLRFDRAYTPIPTCCPARQSLLSGLWPEVHGGLWNYDITLPSPPFESPTWTERLPAAGYRSGYVGKWHVHPERTPLAYGFDDYIAEADYDTWRKAQQPPQEQVKDAQEPWIFGGHERGGPVEMTRTHWLARQAITLIERYQQGGQPWHIRLDHSEPHPPCMPHASFLERYADAEIAPWGNFPDTLDGKPYIQRQQRINWKLESLDWSAWATYVRRYLAMVAQLDDAIGLVLEALRATGAEQNTLVIFTTDHGDACGSHGMVDKHYTLYEEVTHVPLLARWPGVIEPGGRCDAFVVAALDLAATLSEVAGVDFPCQGASLLPWMRGTKPDTWRSHVTSTYNGQQFGLFCQRMIRDTRWKYIWTPTDRDELYDLQTDPWELENRIADPSCREELARLRKELAAELERRGDKLLDGWTRDQLLLGRKADI